MNNNNNKNFFQKNINLIVISMIFLIGVLCYYYTKNDIISEPIMQSGGKIISNKFIIQNVKELTSLLDTF
jgi:hypothetical protein